MHMQQIAPLLILQPVAADFWESGLIGKKIQARNFEKKINRDTLSSAILRATGAGQEWSLPRTGVDLG